MLTILNLTQVDVSLAERSYPIWIGNDFLSHSLELITPQLKKLTHAVLVVDENVQQHAAQAVEQSLVASSVRISRILVPSGESSKSPAELIRLWEEMVAAKTDRASVVFAIGGGVVGDLAGFAAATFARGLSFIQVPTTLLSMVDSSVGGKTGINLPTAKNIVGSFWQPRGVLIDLASLATLPKREFIAGLAEVVKYGVILDTTFFEFIEQSVAKIASRDSATLSQLIARSCQLKAQVVSQDEHETTGLRAILNYGHTFGHALESLTSYGELLHGEAVSIGMMMAANLAASLGMIDRGFIERQRKLLEALELPVTGRSFPAELLWERMMLDKKVQHGRLTFILPTRIGEVIAVRDISFEQVQQSLLS